MALRGWGKRMLTGKMEEDLTCPWEPLKVLKPGGGVSGPELHPRKITLAITWRAAWRGIGLKAS